MKPFMIIGVVEGKSFSKFADTYTEARDVASNIECGLGGYTEIYSRESNESGSEYRLLEA